MEPVEWLGLMVASSSSIASLIERLKNDKIDKEDLIILSQLNIMEHLRKIEAINQRNYETLNRIELKLMR